LAQEGIELVRQVRDSNFLQIMNGESTELKWRDGLEIDGSYTIESKAESGGSVELNSVEPGEAPNFFMIAIPGFIIIIQQENQQPLIGK